MPVYALPFPFLAFKAPLTFSHPFAMYPNPKLHPLILTDQTKKYTSAQLLTQNAAKIAIYGHLSPGLTFSVAIYSSPVLYGQYMQPAVASGFIR